MEKMTRHVLLAAAIAWLFIGPFGAQPSPLPKVLPLFSRIHNAPGFMIECINDTEMPIASNADWWPWLPRRVRVDGNPYEETSGVIGPGLGSDIPPGQTWRGIVTLYQERPTSGPAPVFDARVRGGRLWPLASGRHTIAIQCGDRWSEEFVFYWEPEAERQ